MKHREFVYVGEKIPVLTDTDNSEFLFNFQKSILMSLEKRQLLTRSQTERCIKELESKQWKNAVPNYNM